MCVWWCVCVCVSLDTWAVDAGVRSTPKIDQLPLTPTPPQPQHKNSWEPVHYLAFGSGLQTWEYSPAYTLRSYAYLLPHAALAKGLALALGLLQVGYSLTD